MTKQWISVEEAAEKYQIPVRRIYEWRKKREITFSSVSNFVLLDEDSLVNCIQRNLRNSLSEEEFKRRMDEKLKGSEEELFVFQSLKELTPLARIVLKELAGLVQNDERRELFLYAAMRGSIQDYAVQNDKTYREVQDTFQSIVKEIKSRGEFLKNYKVERALLNAKVRSYEMKFAKFRQEAISKASMELPSPEKQASENRSGTKEETTTTVTSIPEEITALLNTPIQNLEFDVRAQRIIIDAGMITLRDLLLFTSRYGFRKLRTLSQFGEGSLLKVQLRLKRMNILDDDGNCYLYDYLPSAKSE